LLAQEPEPFEGEGYLWGYKDQNGNVAISIKYEFAEYFSEGYALVMLNNKYGFIDIKGKEVIPLIFDNAISFSQDLAAVNKGYGIIDYITYMGKWGFINKKGKEVIPLNYDLVYSFTEGLAAVNKGGIWDAFSEVFIGGTWGFINSKGVEVIPLKYDYAYPFSEGLAPVNKGMKLAFEEEDSGYSTYVVYGKWGFIDINGKEVIPFKYDNTKGGSEGLWPVEINNKWGYIDKNGKEVIPIIYDDAQLFNNGFAQVILDGKYFYINKEGKKAE
jgi:hypothetical protein